MKNLKLLVDVLLQEKFHDAQQSHVLDVARRIIQETQGAEECHAMLRESIVRHKNYTAQRDTEVTEEMLLQEMSKLGLRQNLRSAIAVARYCTQSPLVLQQYRANQETHKISPSISTPLRSCSCV